MHLKCQEPSFLTMFSWMGYFLFMKQWEGYSGNSMGSAAILKGESTKRPGLQQCKIYENLLQSHDELKKVCMHLQWWALQRLTGTNFTNSVVCSSLVSGSLMISLVFR